MRNIVYIDPQSIRNLAIYDHSLLSQIEGNIHYLCSAFYDYKALPPHIKQYKIFYYNNKKNNISKAISYLYSNFVAFFLIMRLHPEVLHLQWLRIPTFDVVYIKIIKRITGCRIVFTAHNILPHDTGKRHYSAYQKMYRAADSIIVHTNSTKRELLQLFDIPEAKIKVIDHGLLNLSYDPVLLEKQMEEYNRHYQINGKMVFSALGYQYYYKGVDVLAEVWATTPELYENPHCKLLLIGKNRGVDFNMTKGIGNIIVEDRIITDEEFYYLMTHTDIYLLPYRSISQSGVLLTAISTSTPFLVTDVGGLKEPLDIAPVGWTIPHLSADVLRQKLLWLLHHPEEVKAAKDNNEGWELLKQHYSWSRIGKLTQQLYHV
jgi:glycosyltransferase involved in cell wall biosynthesis